MQCSCSMTGCGWRVAAVKIVPTLLTNVKKCEECNYWAAKHGWCQHARFHTHRMVFNGLPSERMKGET